MQIQIRPDDVTLTDALQERVEREVQKAMKHFSDRITRVEVTLQDENGPKGGVDKRCVMEAHPAGDDALTVRAESDALEAAVHEAAQKLEKAVGRRLDRLEHRPKK